MTLVESIIERAVVKYARDRDVLVLKLNVRGRRGWPDDLFLFDGRVLFIEFKKPGEKPSPLQTYIMFEIAGRGLAARWVDTREQGIEAVDCLLENRL